jgi:hypothetical protein
MTPKAQFAQRCEAFLKEWDVYDRPQIEPAVRRLCSDERAQSLWALCETLDDEAFRRVMESVVPFSEPKLREQGLQQPQRDYEQAAQQLEIVRRFLALITDPQEGSECRGAVAKVARRCREATTAARRRALRTFRTK